MCIRDRHRRAHRVAVLQPDVVAHADLVAVVHDRGARHGQQQRGEQLDLVAVVLQQRGEPAPDAEVGPHARVLGVLRVHVVALFLGDRLERQLVVVAKEDAPLGALGELGGAGHDLRDRLPRLPAHRHEDARHEREVERHVALVAARGGVAEVLHDVLGPAVGLGEQHPVGVQAVDLGPDPLEVGVGLRQAGAGGALALEEVRHGVQAEAVDAQVEPEPQNLKHGVLNGRVLVVQVGLVVEEPVPVVLAAHRVVGPVGLFGADEDDGRVRVSRRVVRPHVEVPVRPGGVVPGGLEPRVPVACVIHHKVGDDADAPLVCLLDQLHEVPEIAELLEDLHVVGDVVTAVAQRRLVQREQPQAVHAEPLQVVELLDQTSQVAGSVAVGVTEAAHQHFVEDGSLVPPGVGGDEVFGN